MQLGWVGNALMQPTGYGTIARNILPYIAENTDHEVLQFCNTGLNHAIPFEHSGVKLYGTSGRSSKFGIEDIPHVTRKEDVDIWIVNFDAWTVDQKFKQFDFPYVIYPPVDHAPLSPQWIKVFRNAKEIIPYCEFGEKVIREGVDEITEGKVKDHIYHGVKTDTFKPVEVTKKQAFGREIPEDVFVAGIIKNNQGTRTRYDTQIRGFSKFLERIDEQAFLYIHAYTTGNNAFNLPTLIRQNGVQKNVLLVNQDQYRYAFTEEDLNKMYNSMDVLLNATASEGFGLTIAEAMSAETPAIGGGWSAMPELISGSVEEKPKKLHGVTEHDRGWLVPYSSLETTVGKHSRRAVYNSEDVAEALYKAYRQFKENGLEEKGRAGRKWAKKYDWDKIGDKWVDYVDGLEDRVMRSPEPGEQKRAYLVVGPESSGTRITTKILTELGCEGDTGHVQKWDSNPPIEPDKVVWRRSVPHDGQWPNFQKMAKILRSNGYQVTAVVTLRDMHATLNSQVNASYLTINNPQTAFNNVNKAYRHIFSKLGDIKVVISSFDNLIQRPDQHIDWLKKMLDLEGEVDVDIEDVNEKYYEGGQDD